MVHTSKKDSIRGEGVSPRNAMASDSSVLRDRDLLNGGGIGEDVSMLMCPRSSRKLQTSPDASYLPLLWYLTCPRNQGFSLEGCTKEAGTPRLLQTTGMLHEWYIALRLQKAMEYRCTKSQVSGDILVQRYTGTDLAHKFHTVHYLTPSSILMITSTVLGIAAICNRIL